MWLWSAFGFVSNIKNNKNLGAADICVSVAFHTGRLVFQITYITDNQLIIIFWSHYFHFVKVHWHEAAREDFNSSMEEATLFSRPVLWNFVEQTL